MKLKKGDKVKWDSINGIRFGIFIKFHKNGYAIVSSCNSDVYLPKLDECNLRRA